MKKNILISIIIVIFLFNLDIVMNSVMIPIMGAVGAAFASFVTQLFANFILGFIMRPIRESNVLLLRGINPKFLIKESKGLISMLKKEEIPDKNFEGDNI